MFKGKRYLILGAGAIHRARIVELASRACQDSKHLSGVLVSLAEAGHSPSRAAELLSGRLAEFKVNWSFNDQIHHKPNKGIEQKFIGKQDTIDLHKQKMSCIKAKKKRKKRR